LTASRLLRLLRLLRWWLPVAVAVALSVSVSAVSADAGILTGSRVQVTVHPGISLSRSSGTATVPVRVSGGGFGASEKVSVFFGAARLDVTRATRAGRFGPVTITVPVSVTPGSKYRILARGWTSKRTASESFAVPADGLNWPQFHYQASQDGYDNTENELTPSDVHLLGLKWRCGPGGIVSATSPVVANGVVYVTPESTLGDLTAVFATRASTCAPARWSPLTPGADVAEQSPPSDTTPTISGGTLYVGSAGSVFYAYSLATRQQEWSFDTSQEPGSGTFTSATVADGAVYFGSSDGLYYALNAASGAQIWSYHTDPSAEASPAVANGLVYLAGGGNVVALGAGTGTVMWTYPNLHTIESAPAVANGIVYVTDDNDTILALNAYTGAKMWSAGISGTGSSPAVANGVVYTGSTNGDLYALNAATGSVLWTYPIGTGLVSPPSVANGVVYIGANSQETVYALNAASGKKLWSYNLSSAGPGETVKSSPAIADGVLYVNAGNVYAFDLK